MAVTYYCQSGATSNNCGGTDADDSLARSGTDGVSNSTTTFTSATAAFVANDVGRGIWINTTTARWRIIASVTNGTTVVLNSALTTTQSGLSWKIGGSWLTWTQLTGANGLASGDTAYIAPGTYREVVTFAMTSAVANTNIFGDPANQQGFKNSSAVAISPGDVILSAYTTNDTTTPSANAVLSLAGRDYLTFQYITFVGGNANPGVINATTATSTNINFKDCYFAQNATNAQLMSVSNAADIAFTWTIDRCIFLNTSNFAILISLVNSASADYSVAFTVQNCLFVGGGGIIGSALSGAGTFRPGGINILNNTAFCGGNVVDFNTNMSTTFVNTVYNNILRGGTNSGIRAVATNQILEDYNVIISQTARTNVTAGAHSIVNPTDAVVHEVGQSWWNGRLMRPFGIPVTGSPLIGFGNQAGGPAYDLQNRQRAAGSASASYAVGAYERHDTGIAGGAANADAGNCLQLGPGPADHDFLIPVNAVATVISIKQNTASYGGTAYPQITLLANGELGVATQTVADSSAHTSYTTLTLASFTPSKAGWVTLRLQNLTNDGVGIVYWDTAVLPSVNLTSFDNYNRTEPFPAIDAAAGGIMCPVEG